MSEYTKDIRFILNDAKKEYASLQQAWIDGDWSKFGYTSVESVEDRLSTLREEITKYDGAIGGQTN